MKFDLHSHSTASDGKLAPEAVLQLAIDAGVELFALTDHDTLQGFLSLPDTDQLQLVSGIELSTVWASQGIHIVGLDFDPRHQGIQAAVAHQAQARAERAERINEKLIKRGLPDTLGLALNYSQARETTGRPHFAQALVDLGKVRTVAEAFKKYLSDSKLGNIRTGWPDIATAIAWITEASGVAVLAHPLHYKLTRTRLTRLVEHFAESGGHAIEVTESGYDRSQQEYLLSLADRFNLAASGGSDFHSPEWRHARLGHVSPLPQGLKPVWQQFRRTSVTSNTKES